MGKQIIVQPDGRLCVWSTNTDSITMFNFTDDELVELFAERAAEDARRDTRATIEKVRSAPRGAYYQFTMSFAEAVGEHLGRGEPLPGFDLGTESQPDWPADWPPELIGEIEAVRDRWRDDLEEAGRG